jgi:chromosome transmission fidelity protein 1
MAPHVAERGVAGEKITSEPIRDFHHPYTPYDIQDTFMNTVYEILDNSKVGILESPTGTVSLFSLAVE